MRLAAFFTVVAFIAPSPAAQAQSGTSQSTLAGRSPTYGGYFALDSRFTKVAAKFGVLAGADAVLLVNHRYSIGLGGWGLAVNNKASDESGSNTPRLHMGYGGLRLGYIAQPASPIHATFDVLVGGGEINHGEGTDEGNFFVVEPTVGLEASLTSSTRLVAGISYRAISGLDLSGIRGGDVRGVSGVLALRIGKF